MSRPSDSQAQWKSQPSACVDASTHMHTITRPHTHTHVCTYTHTKTHRDTNEASTNGRTDEDETQEEHKWLRCRSRFRLAQPSSAAGLSDLPNLRSRGMCFVRSHGRPGRTRHGVDSRGDGVSEEAAYPFERLGGAPDESRRSVPMPKAVATLGLIVLATGFSKEANHASVCPRGALWVFGYEPSRP